MAKSRYFTPKQTLDVAEALRPLILQVAGGCQYRNGESEKEITKRIADQFPDHGVTFDKLRRIRESIYGRLRRANSQTDEGSAMELLVGLENRLVLLESRFSAIQDAVADTEALREKVRGLCERVGRLESPTGSRVIFPKEEYEA